MLRRLMSAVRAWAKPLTLEDLIMIRTTDSPRIYAALAGMTYAG